MKLKIEYLAVDDLKPYAGNAKLHPAEQVEQIKRSIEEFGMNDPIAIWGENEIVEGHGRLLALQDLAPERRKELGLDKIPVIRLDGLTDEQRRAYALVHNKLTMNSDFESFLLHEELDSIEDIDMSEFGFADIEFDVDEAEEVSDDPAGVGSVTIKFENDEQAEWVKWLIKEESDLKAQYKAETIMGRYDMQIED